GTPGPGPRSAPSPACSLVPLLSEATAPPYTCACTYLTTNIGAHANISRKRCRGGLRPARGGAGAGPPWAGGLALAAAGPRHAHAPTRQGSRRRDGLGAGRFRRARSAGGGPRRVAHDGVGGPGAHLSVRHVPSRSPAGR